MKEKLQTRMEPDNIMVTFAVAVVKSETVVGYVMKGKTRRFAKTIFFYLFFFKNDLFICYLFKVDKFTKSLYK